MSIIIETCPNCKRNNWDTSGRRCLDCGYRKSLEFICEDGGWSTVEDEIDG